MGLARNHLIVTGAYWGFTLMDGALRMLSVKLSLQITGLLLLSALSPDWNSSLSLAWVVTAQGVAGVAKDLTKTASRSAIKATSEGGPGSSIVGLLGSPGPRTR